MKTQLLLHGRHRRREDGVNAMEMVAWMAGEKHSSRPECACPALTAFAHGLNNTYWPGGDVQRTAVMGPVLPLLVGSRTTEAVYRRRGYFFADRVVRELVPMVLESRERHLKPVAAAVFRELAKTLRMLPAIVDVASADVAGRVARDLSDALTATARSFPDQWGSKRREGQDAAYAAGDVAVAANAANDAAAEVADAADAAARTAVTVAVSVAVTAGNYDADDDASLPSLLRAAEILAEAARITAS